MLASELTPPPEGRVRFLYAALRQAPDASGCYALAVSDGVVLYVGKAVNIARRMEQHLDKGEKNKMTPSGKVSWLYYAFFPEGELSRRENGWINEYQIRMKGEMPFFNKISPSV